MSRIGNKPIPVPTGVTVELEGSHMRVKGPKGTLEQTLRPEVDIAVQDSQIVVTRAVEDKLHRSLHGLTRTLISNMVVGVTDGFTRTLEIAGVGYRPAPRHHLRRRDPHPLHRVGHRQAGRRPASRQHPQATRA
jgi:large subunit ribosomal protein L6